MAKLRVCIAPLEDRIAERSGEPIQHRGAP